VVSKKLQAEATHTKNDLLPDPKEKPLPGTD
jgi:hypothetical protein